MFGQKVRETENENLTQFHMDIASSVQKVIEEKLKIAKEEFVRVQERMSSMKHKLTESRHDISRLDQQQQLAEKRWEEDKVKILTEKATIVSEMKIMSREKRQSDLYIQELKDRLAIFEKGNVGHHHHGRHHHHHHEHHHHPHHYHHNHDRPFDDEDHGDDNDHNHNEP